MISLNNTFPVRHKVDSTARTARRKSMPRKRAARRRLDPAERKKKILEEATRFFAVNGLDAQIKISPLRSAFRKV